MDARIKTAGKTGNRKRPSQSSVESITIAELNRTYKQTKRAMFDLVESPPLIEKP